MPRTKMPSNCPPVSAVRALAQWPLLLRRGRPPSWITLSNLHRCFQVVAPRHMIRARDFLEGIRISNITSARCLIIASIVYLHNVLRYRRSSS